MKKKSLLIVCDGLGDRPVNGVTPLEAAYTPNMDKMASEGICGLMDTVLMGVRPGSDTAHLSLFGYNPFKYYAGRGPFEAAGVGLTLKKGDVAFRCNFASIKDDKIVDRRAGREEEGLSELSREINNIKIEGIELIYKKAAGHRAVLVLKGEDLSSNVSDTDPEGEAIGYNKSKPLDDSAQAAKTADILNEFTQKAIKLLAEHEVNKKRTQKNKLPANIILARGVGMKASIPSIKERLGISAACISATTLIKGVAREVGMDLIEVEGASGHVDSNIKAKMRATIKALKKYDFVFLHLKGTDEASHDGDFESKKNMLERIDVEVIGPILNDVKDCTIALTGDHSTPISIRQHSADPVPIVIVGDVREDKVKKFTERECAGGGLNRIRGLYLLNIMLDISDRVKLYGA
ncbi:MAG: phosphoglycerate mutase [Candidatus Altiarchaeales archaeon ex4484_96]|nr:MAG: phosphoglycerate mutase [Candidatus Altiarchaeales archaeon ex4484_96]